MNIGNHVMPKIDRIGVKTAQIPLAQLWVMEIKPEIEVPPGKLFPVSYTAGGSPCFGLEHQPWGIPCYMQCQYLEVELFKAFSLTALLFPLQWQLD